METNGVKVIPTINKQNNLQGFRFEFDGHNLKGSEVHRSMSIGNIGKQMGSIENVKNLKQNTVGIKLAGKMVNLTPNLTLKLTKFLIKKVIQHGISYKKISVMTKLEELTALLVNEINDFKNGFEKLERINAQLAETKIKMDMTEYKITIESHQQQIASCIKSIESFQNRFDSKIKQAKIYPDWASVIFILSLLLSVISVLLIFIKLKT